MATMAEEDADKRAQVSLRPVTPEDEPFLFEVYASTRADEMALVPWNDAEREAFLKMQFAAQQSHYRKYNPGAAHDIIIQGSTPVGRLYVARREDELHILDITVLPAYRNKGIGTPLIKRLMDEAAATGKPLTIYVESFNPSQRLFGRLGFLKLKDDGVNCLMAWRA